MFFLIQPTAFNMMIKYWSRFLLLIAVLGCVVGNLPDKELVIMTLQGDSFLYDTATQTEEPIPIVFGSRSEVRPYNSLSQRNANELFFYHYYIVPGKDSAIVLNRSPNGNVSQLVCALPNCSVGLKFAAVSHAAGKPAVDLHVDCLSGSTSGAVDIRVATFSFAAKACSVHSSTPMGASSPPINRRTGAVVLYDSDSQDHSYVFVRNRTVLYYHGSLSDPKSLSNLPDYEVEQIADFSETQFVFESSNRSLITHTGFYDFSRVSPIPGSLLPPHKPGRLVWSDDRSYLGSISHSDNTLTLANVAKPGSGISLGLPAGLQITSLSIVPLGDEVFIAFFAAGMGVYRGRVSDGSEGVAKIDGSSTACTENNCLGPRVFDALQGLVLWQEKNRKGLVVFDLVKSERYGPFPTSDLIFRVAMLSPSSPASVTTAAPTADSTTAIAVPVAVVAGLLIVIAVAVVAILVLVKVILIRRRKQRNIPESEEETKQDEVVPQHPASSPSPVPSVPPLDNSTMPQGLEQPHSTQASDSSLTSGLGTSGRQTSASGTPSSPASLSQDSDQPRTPLASGPTFVVVSPSEERDTGGGTVIVYSNGLEKEIRSEPYGAESHL